MSRNVSGTYSLYTPGNPVVPSTVVTTTWANNTLSDIATALTDSLSRSGQGGMSASLGLASGVIGAPGLSWTAETTSGLYRAGAGDFRYSIAATDIASIVPQGLRVLAGTAPLPSIAFLTDTTTGMYRAAASRIGFATAGVNRFTIDAAFVETILPLGSGDGLVGNPGQYFANDPDNGMYRIGANNWGIVAGGVKIIDLVSTGAGITGTFAVSGLTTHTASIVPAVTLTPSLGSAALLWNTAFAGTFSAGTNSELADFSTTTARLARGSTWTQIQFGNGTSNPTYSFLGSGATAFGGAVSINAGATTQVLVLNSTGANGAYSTWQRSSTSIADMGNSAQVFGGGTLDNFGLGTRSTQGVDLGTNGAVRFKIDGTTGLTSILDASGGTFFAAGFRSVPRSTTATTLVVNDNGKCVAVTAAIAIPASIFSAGDCVSVYNDSAASINITIAAGTLRLAGTTTTGTRALAARGSATLWFNVGGATPEVIASGPGLS